MTKRKSPKSNSPATTIGTIITAILVVIAAIISQISGGNDTSGTPTPIPVSTIQTGGTAVANIPNVLTTISVPQGFGAQRSFWQVYFTAPSGSSDRSTYTAGIDTALAAALGRVQSTLDIAAYEFNNPILTRAVLDAKARGVRVRLVTDNEDGLEDDNTTIHQFVDAGIPVVDDGRGDLMHDKFMILDSTEVWTGSWNYTVNDTYRNNNNALVLRSQRAVQNYQTEFDEMFTRREFGPRSTANTPNASFSQDGVPIQMYFAPEDEVVDAIVTAISSADSSVRFMAFSFTLDPVGAVLLNEATSGIRIQGIFETTGSETQFSELTPLRCAGLDVRQDGNPFILHHKVFIVDDDTVVLGSFNFSASATESNDENLVIIQDRDLAGQYIAEFDRRWAESRVPANIRCS